MENKISKKAQAIRQNIESKRGMRARAYPEDRKTQEMIDAYIKERMKEESKR